MFYNTGISTYVWILTNDKAPEDAGLVRLVDARAMGTKMRKSLGDKRKELTGDAIAEIVNLFLGARGEFADDPRVKVLPREAFGFQRITVERPMRRRWEVTPEAVAAEPFDAYASLVGQRYDTEKALLAEVTGPHPGAAEEVRQGLRHPRPRRARHHRPRRRGRARPRPARQRERPPARRLVRPRRRRPRQGPRRGRRDPPRDRDPPLRPRRLDRPHQDQGRRRDPLHPPVLRLPTTPPRRGDRRRDQGPRDPDPDLDEGPRLVMRPLAAMASFENGYPFKPEELVDEGTAVIRIRQLVDPSAEVDRFQGELPTRYRIQDGDLVFSWSGSLAVRFWDRGPAYLNQHLFRVDPRPGISQRWLGYVLEASLPRLEGLMHGSAMTHITRPMLKLVRWDTPGLPEQRRIADFLDDRVARIDQIIATRREQSARLVASLEPVDGSDEAAADSSAMNPIRRSCAPSSMDPRLIPGLEQKRTPGYGWCAEATSA